MTGWLDLRLSIALEFEPFTPTMWDLLLEAVTRWDWLPVGRAEKPTTTRDRGKTRVDRRLEQRKYRAKKRALAGKPIDGRKARAGRPRGWKCSL